MIDPNFIRQNPEKVKTNTTERGNNPDVVDAWLETDRKRNELIQAKDEKREERNSLTFIEAPQLCVASNGADLAGVGSGHDSTQ